MKNLLVVAASLLSAGTAFGKDPGKLYVQAGPAYIVLQEEVEIVVEGASIVRGDTSTSDAITAAVAIGYNMTPSWSLSLLIGIPPEFEATGEGVLSPLGELGTLTFAPVAGFLNYHFLPDSKFQPFVGVGLVYNTVVGSSDASLVDFSGTNEWGTGVRGGFDYMFAEDRGVFFSIGRLFLGTDITGTVSPTVPVLGGADAFGDAELNPIVTQAGLTFRF